MTRATSKVYAPSSKEMEKVSGLLLGTRGDFLTGVWDYIKSEDLKEGKEIYADDLLKSALGTRKNTLVASDIMKLLGNGIEAAE